MEYFFWFFFFVIIYVYIGYLIILILISFAGNSAQREEITPSITLFIPVYNEDKIIEEKILNSIAMDYPKDKLEIIVASDGSTDETVNIVKKFLKDGVILFERNERKGKNYVINTCIPMCKGKVIVFTDANSFFKEDVIKKLVKNFSNEKVGCVIGNLRYVQESTSVGKGEGLYFRYESLLKRLESKFGTVVAATGAIYAIRKSLFTPLDLDVANDFAHPVHIAAMGYKVLFEPEAIAYEKATSFATEEFKRRARIVTRGITGFMRYRRPYRMLRGMRGFCFISHKLLRWFIPFFLIAIFLSNLFLYTPFFRFTLYSQVVFYSMALIGIFRKKKSSKFFSIPSYFCIINLAALIGIIKYFLGERQSIWEVAKTTR